MKNNGNIGLALITGAALGAAASILFAPARGIETRKKITRSAEDATDAIIRAGEKLKKSTTKKYYEGKHSLETSLNAITSQVNQNSEEYLPLLERKLEELRKKSRTLNKKRVKVK